MSGVRQPILSIIWFKAIAELKAEASRAYIGILWWLIEPLLYMAVFYLVFAVGFRSGGSEFIVFLLVALVPWKWFQSTVQAGANVIVANRGLISQVYFPKYILVGMIIVSNLLKFAIILCLLLILLITLEVSPSYEWWWVLPCCMTLLLLMAGVSTVAASIMPFFPDLKLIVDNGLMFLFFASGIFFDISTRSPDAQKMLYLNPLALWIEDFRNVLIYGNAPDLSSQLVVALIGISLLFVGVIVMRKLDRKFAKVAT